MNSENELNGEATFEFSFIKKENEVCPFNDIDVWNNGLINQLFIVINNGKVLIPINSLPLSSDEFEIVINEWLNENNNSSMLFRGRSIKAKDCVNKLKKLGFEIIKITGSHYQLMQNGTSSKVTVPVHHGEIPKGTLSSILKQAGISWDTLVAV